MPFAPSSASGTLGGALFRMAGRGIAPPDAGPANAAMKPSAYGVRTEDEARAAVREQAARGVDVIKIWVDDRNGSVPKLSPELARAVIDEAHRHKLKVIAHIFYLDDAKWLARARIDGFAHLVRDREADDELVTLMRDNGVVIIPNMAISQNGMYAAPPDWLDDPLFRAVTPAEDAERIRASFSGRTAQAVERAAATFRGMQRSVARMKAAGVKFAFGTDAGAVRDHVHAFTDHRELDIMVRAGPDADGGDCRGDERIGRARGPHRSGRADARQERRLHRARRQSTRGHQEYAPHFAGLPDGVAELDRENASGRKCVDAERKS